MTTESRYWIAINGASCALSIIPMINPKVAPTPGQLLGFPTLEEARKAQQVCLNAPIKEAEMFLRCLWPDVRAGRIVAINPANPEPLAKGQTVIWFDDKQPRAK